MYQLLTPYSHYLSHTLPTVFPFPNLPPFCLLDLHAAAYTVLSKLKSGHVISLFQILQCVFILLRVKSNLFAFLHMSPVLLSDSFILFSLHRSSPPVTLAPHSPLNPASVASPLVRHFFLLLFLLQGVLFHQISVRVIFSHSF